MEYIIDDTRPIFVQIAERIENDIVAGELPEEAQVPSTNQFASFYQINPATAGKGVNLLVDQGMLYKKRGLGMYVAPGARAKLLEKRREQFFEQYVVSMLREAEKLGMRFVHIPINGFAAPTNEEVIQFLSLFRGDPQQKVFVHCLLGEDRTGVFVATYRMSVQKWPAAQALHEMNAFGFNGFWHPAMKSFVRDFPARLTSAPAFAHLQDAKSPLLIVPNPKPN